MNASMPHNIVRVVEPHEPVTIMANRSHSSLVSNHDQMNFITYEQKVLKVRIDYHIG